MGVKRNLDESGILNDSGSETITEQEAALYDRQIRLWGVDCQKRLREAKLLVIGLNGVTSEAVKNLTLSGVKQITIFDDAQVSPSDFTAHIFVTQKKLGKTRAEASAPAIRELNPNVIIDIQSGDIFSKSDDFYKDFQALIATDCSIDVLIKLNDLCRRHNIQFYCTDTWGFYGYCFLDLQNHNAVVKERPETKMPETRTPETKKKRSEPKWKEVKFKYYPLSETLSAKVGKGLRKKVSKVYIIFQVINNFRGTFKRCPEPSSRESDIEELKKIRDLVCESLEYDSSKISDEMLSSVFGELSPICSVVGGVLANDIIRGISKNGMPINNYFLFDGHESVGVNETIFVTNEKQ